MLIAVTVAWKREPFLVRLDVRYDFVSLYIEATLSDRGALEHEKVVKVLFSFAEVCTFTRLLVDYVQQLVLRKRES